ncbi:phage holin [Staphylococcus epidermidis]|uniref:phage holin n=1 Tax=Staphylococcus epidermidis TaxID=1282 RepID=UPI0009B2DAFE
MGHKFQALLLFAKQVTEAFGIDISTQLETVSGIIGSIITLLVTLGVITIPNTKRISDAGIDFELNKPHNGIIGGAKFVRKQFFNKGKNTLYRMRWNPKNPGHMQYATAIEWCNFQATTISSLYKKVGAKGMYYIRDKYR